MYILALSKIFLEHPELCSIFELKTVQSYVELVNLIKPKISALQGSYQEGPPNHLSVNIHEFLKKCFSMSDYMGKLAWASFRSIAWNTPFTSTQEEQAARLKHIKLILEHGLPHNIDINPLGVYNLEPPRRTCLDPRCGDQLLSNENIIRDRELAEPLTHPISIFTRDLGAVPGYSTSRYCRKCNTRYYHNYYVHKAATTRTYYGGPIPAFIQISQHFFMTAELCDLFATMMFTSWTSATNCARIYNGGLINDVPKAALPADWQTSLVIDLEDVWNGFYLHSLLLHHYEKDTTFILPHQAESQAKRLEGALRERNQLMAGPGQEAWNHACKLCSYVYVDKNGKKFCLRSNITDGTAIGRPCCRIPDCKAPLPSSKHHYCQGHRSLAELCAVVACSQKAEKGFLTCSDIEHRNIETYHHQRGKAMFQLKHRLERLRVSQTHDSLATTVSAAAPNRGSAEDSAASRQNDNPLPSGQADFPLEGVGADEDEDILLDSNGIYHEVGEEDNVDLCNGKPETGNRSAKARFGRRRTHNEELCVASCGVILGRATFYGSEAPNGVRAFSDLYLDILDEAIPYETLSSLCPLA
ncbi:hypothetical protein CVT26_000266 [Gymnopilus dilepis]|uniref:CxC5 like cysteine cluster associated with KDZ domain-containing protein n=1 Tax=Gymnopilus dilepis TaxID=231916 RepID=A0A409WE57_9AGAR|nr:hypothetical protein CVT26_000266 [Gymnopilus dilepis]